MRPALALALSLCLAAGCVYVPPTAVVFAIEDSLSEAHEIHVQVLDPTTGEVRSHEVLVVRPRAVTPRARCVSVVPENLREGARAPLVVRLRTVRRVPDGTAELTGGATVRTTMRVGERRLVRVPLTAACGTTQSATCLARPASETDCGGIRCRCGPAGCLDPSRTCAAADPARPDDVQCSVEPRVDEGVLAGDRVDEDGCLSAL